VIEWSPPSEEHASPERQLRFNRGFDGLKIALVLAQRDVAEIFEDAGRREVELGLRKRIRAVVVHR